MSDAPRRLPPAAVAAVLVAVFLFAFLGYRGPGTGYWDTYIAVPAAVIAGTPVELTDLNGVVVHTGRVAERLPHDLIQEDSFGIATNDQRLGAGVHHATGFLALGLTGFRVVHALDLTLAAGLVLVALRRLGVPDLAALPAGALVALNPMVGSIATLNAGLTSLTMIALLFALMAHPSGSVLVAGIVFGLLGGVRNMAIFFIPAVLAWLLLRERRVRAVALFGIGALVAIAPFLAWKQFAFGSPIADPTQYPLLEGHRPTFPHRWFGIGPEFLFNGLLNWPFHHQLVRTPHFAFPTYLTLPLTFARCFGSVLTAAALIGAVLLPRRDRRLGIVSALWFGLFFAFLLPQENWEELKTTTVVLLFVPWCLWIGTTLGALADPTRRKRVALALIAGALAITALARVTRDVEAPVDPRWYVRFPHAVASESGLAELPDSERLRWTFFHTAETPGEIARRRDVMTAIWPWPMPHIPPPPGAGHGPAQLGGELFERQLVLFDVWTKIYAPATIAEQAAAAKAASELEATDRASRNADGSTHVDPYGARSDAPEQQP